MEKPTAQQLREELLIEFDFTAPANWGIPALSKKLAELQAARDADQGADDEDQGANDEGQSADESLNQQGNEDAANQSKPSDNHATANESTAAATDLGAGISNEPATIASLPATRAENETVLMVTLLNHEVPGSDPKQVRVRNEHFYTSEPEQYAGVAKVVAELAPDDSEAL